MVPQTIRKDLQPGTRSPGGQPCPQQEGDRRLPVDHKFPYPPEEQLRTLLERRGIDHQERGINKEAVSQDRPFVADNTEEDGIHHDHVQDHIHENEDFLRQGFAKTNRQSPDPGSKVAPYVLEIVHARRYKQFDRIEEKDHQHRCHGTAPVTHDQRDRPAPGQTYEHILHARTSFEPEGVRADPDTMGIYVTDNEWEERCQVNPVLQENQGTDQECHSARKDADIPIGPGQFDLVDRILPAIEGTVQQVRSVNNQSKGCLLYTSPSPRDQA
eukprot:TRINITY_DN35273_c0_g1_i1.p4 TRINITY_DN35273_c0_g1~~TRINITY_DN35273_c0_g1_i1.p4  ORF type:complete len:271 (-),score=-1.82 TRINITY_DN35273_c0_g1_i1:128-940(-)